MADRITRIALTEPYPTSEYAHAMVVEAGRMAVFSGVCPLDGDEKVVAPGDLDAQTDQVVANAMAILANAGATPEDVVRTVVYVASTESEELAKVWDRLLESDLGPTLRAAATLLGVATLGYPGQLLEVELTAALP
jgi:enamine deaminase RidA (YjgF/YER057c/UK114 family)